MTTNTTYLRIPLPPPLTHGDIAFVVPAPRAPQSITGEEIVAIGCALLENIPYYEPAAPLAPWSLAGRMEGILRWPR